MNLSLKRKPIERHLSSHQKKRISKRANRRTKHMAVNWRASAFHQEVLRLTKRKKARVALKAAKVFGFSKRKQVLLAVGKYADDIIMLNARHEGQKLQNELTYAKREFSASIRDILGKKTNKFLDIFENVHG